MGSLACLSHVDVVLVSFALGEVLLLWALGTWNLVKDTNAPIYQLRFFNLDFRYSLLRSELDVPHRQIGLDSIGPVAGSSFQRLQLFLLL